MSTAKKKKEKPVPLSLGEAYPEFDSGISGIPGTFHSDIQKELIASAYNEGQVKDALDSLQKHDEWFETETIVVWGDNVAQTRPRSASVGKGVVIYDEAPVRIWKNNIRLVTQNILRDDFVPARGDCHLYINVFKRIPKSFSERRRILAELGLIRPEKTPDLDNYVKSVQDALKGVLWMDDCQVTYTESKKLYSMKPRLEFKLLFRAERLDK